MAYEPYDSVSKIQRMGAPKSPVIKAALEAIRENKQGLYGVTLLANGLVLVHDRASGLQTSWYPDGEVHSGVQSMAPAKILAKLTTARSRAELLRKYTPRSRSPVADKQKLTMNTAGHPMGDQVGPYIPPSVVSTHAGPRGKPIEAPLSLADLNANPRMPADMIDILRLLYPPGPGSGPDDISPAIENSQAIGDRSPTQMTNPLPGYRPTTMVNTPPARSIATMINQHLASQPKSLVNTPLAGSPLTMGRR